MGQRGSSKWKTICLESGRRVTIFTYCTSCSNGATLALLPPTSPSSTHLASFKEVPLLTSTHPFEAILVLHANKSSPIESHCYHYSRFSSEILSSHHVKAVDSTTEHNGGGRIRVARAPIILVSIREGGSPFLLLPSLLLFSPHHLSIHPSTLHLISVSQRLSHSLCFVVFVAIIVIHHPSLPFFLPPQKSLAE